MSAVQLQPMASFNPYSPPAYMQPGRSPAAVAPSAYGGDAAEFAFYDVNRPASTDSAITKMFVGGLTGFRFTKSPGQNLTQFGLNSVGIGAAISGGLSVVKNVASLSYGKQDASRTVSNILTDTLQGGVSALGGTIGGVGANRLLTALGAAAGAPLTIATIVGGAVGAVALNHILNTENLRNTLRS